jgi:hypothetical protein
MRAGAESAADGEAGAPRLFATVFSRSSLSKCVPIALFVGALPSLVNQGSAIFGGTATAATWIRVLVNFLVPFRVSSAGFHGSRRAVWRAGRPSHRRHS